VSEGGMTITRMSKGTTYHKQGKLDKKDKKRQLFVNQDF
jgi:hypothetical protein